MIMQWLENISFAWPWAFGLFILIPILVIEYYRRNKRSQAAMMVSTTHFIGDVRNFRTNWRNLPFWLRIIALSCFIIALARPQTKFEEQQAEGEGIDIVLCFDISGSMTEKDFPPNRLEAAKDVASDFVKGRTGDRIGVVIFSRQSFTLCPITSDHNAVATQIQNIQSGYLQDEGTAIGSGLATSVDRLRTSKAKSKIVVLLTDGVDFGGEIPPDIARDMARLYKIKVYTIGVGSEKEIEEVVDSPLGPVRQRKKLEYNEALLQQLASATGGQYFHALDREALTKIYSSIDRLEKSKIEVKTYPRYSDKFFPFLVIGLAFLFLEILLRYTLFRKFP
jgi:Ca-activated chloride channel family protein